MLELLHFLDSILPIFVILTFAKATYEYIKGQKWKKSEFLSKEIKDFFDDEDIKLVCSLLDWNSRKVKIDDKVILVTDELLISSLKTHNIKSQFTKDEACIRDLFDNFFDKMSYFNIHIKNSLIDEKEVLNYLTYYVDILHTPGRKPIELVKIFEKYIEYYDYSNMIELVNRHKKYKRT